VSYEDMWSTWWADASSSDKNLILDIKYFNWDIFTGITGIKEVKIKEVKKTKVKKDKDIITLNGKTYKLIKEV
jgi:hypothetical protein